MIRKTVTYHDFDGNEVTKEFYFNLNQMEVRELDKTIPGGLQPLLEKIQLEKDTDKIVDLLDMLILWSYGERDGDDGRFIKEDSKGRRLSKYFKLSEAWDVMFMDLVQNERELTDFLLGILPPETREKVRAEMEGKEVVAAAQPALTPIKGGKN